MGAQIISASVHAADAVSITIGDETDIVRMFFKEGRAARIILFNWLRIDATKKRIMGRVQSSDSAGRSRQQLFKATCADAEQGLMCEAKFRFGDQLEVHQLFKCRKMSRAHILDFDSRVLRRRVPARYSVAVQATLDCLTGC